MISNDGKKTVDWEKIETVYRTGTKSLREIAAEFGVSHVAITKRSKKYGWVKDLTANVGEKVFLKKPKDQKDKAGFVYVIYIDDSSKKRFYKIGMAETFYSRFQDHQCASPFDICVAMAFFVGNMRKTEGMLHDTFKDKRIRGEWFDLAEEDLDYISTMAKLI